METEPKVLCLKEKHFDTELQLQPFEFCFKEQVLCFNDLLYMLTLLSVSVISSLTYVCHFIVIFGLFSSFSTSLSCKLFSSLTMFIEYCKCSKMLPLFNRIWYIVSPFSTDLLISLWVH